MIYLNTPIASGDLCIVLGTNRVVICLSSKIEYFFGTIKFTDIFGYLLEYRPENVMPVSFSDDIVEGNIYGYKYINYCYIGCVDNIAREDSITFKNKDNSRINIYKRLIFPAPSIVEYLLQDRIEFTKEELDDFIKYYLINSEPGNIYDSIISNCFFDVKSIYKLAILLKDGFDKCDYIKENGCTHQPKILKLTSFIINKLILFKKEPPKFLFDIMVFLNKNTNNWRV